MAMLRFAFVMPVLLLVLSFLMSVFVMADGTEIRGLAWPALSHDGQSLAFEWLSDIWVAPSQGGEAIRVVKHPAREAYPKFSPDGTRLFFSSERSGSLQVHSVQLDGRNLQMHSHNTEGNILEAIAPDGSYAIVRGLRDSSGYEPFRLMKINLVKQSRELELFDASAHSVSISPNGSQFLFCQGGEQLYRKGYHGSRASSIHLYDETVGKFTEVILQKWEARSPFWKPSGKGFYYVSGNEEGFELWEKDFDGGEARKVIQQKQKTVVIPVLSGNGKVMVFRSEQEIYRFNPEERTAPKEIHFFTKEKVERRKVRKERVTGSSGVAFSKKAKQIVFSAAGDLWWMKLKDVSPIRLFATDEIDECEPIFSHDESEIFYLSDDGLSTEVCRAGWKDGKITSATVLPTAAISKRSLKLSPDGSAIAWLEGNGNLVTYSFVQKHLRLAAKAWDTLSYDWSPDGKCLVMSAKDVHSNRDIFLVRADGSQAPYNLTRHPAFEGSPKFSPDGNNIVFIARRDADEVARLWLIPLSWRENGEIDLEQSAASIRPLSTRHAEPIRVTWAADSRSVLYQSRDKSDAAIHAVGIIKGNTKEYAKFRGIPAGIEKDGVSFWRRDRVPMICQSGKSYEFRFSFVVEQERKARLRLGFRRIWRTLGERFYDPSLNGKDWEMIRQNYETAAAEAYDSRQFDRVIAQLLGELNASHLTFQTRPWGVPASLNQPKAASAFPGMNFQNTWQGKLIVEKILQGSPIAQEKHAPQVGETVIRMAGREVSAETSLEEIFRGAEGHSLPLVVADKSGKERTLELVPISYEEARLLAQLAELESAAKWGGERIAYLPFRKMNTDHLRGLSVELYRASLSADALILDLRGNGGGRVTDELLDHFTQPTHSFTIPRNGERGYPNDRRTSSAWSKPMVVLCNENTYSNAEIFCHAFKHIKRGKLIGKPTNGGVISAVTIKVPEVGILQVPFRGWFHIETGKDLELNGAVPDVTVSIPLSDQVRDYDTQLSTAVKFLQKEIETPIKEVPSILKSAK